MAKKNITIDDSARMIKKGFDETATRTQTDRLEKRMDGIDKRLMVVEEKLNNIEKLILKQHAHQIQNLERRIRYLEELFAVK